MVYKIKSFKTQLQSNLQTTIKIWQKGPGGSPAVGGRELSWAYFNLKTVLTLPNYNLIYTLLHTNGIRKIS